MIWFSSDWHYWHKNITYGDSVWPDKETKTRKFDSVQEMSRALVASINKYVMEDDILYFLGDYSFSGVENIYNFWKQINCKNIHFIPGNHDGHIRKNVVLPNCKRVEPYSRHIIDGKPIGGEYPDYVEVQTLFKEYLPELTMITIDKQQFVLCHYPIEEWENMNRGAIILHGHCHHNIDDCELNTKYRRMDVGIDWEEFRPYSLDEILETMSHREIKTHGH